MIIKHESHGYEVTVDTEIFLKELRDLVSSGCTAVDVGSTTMEALQNSGLSQEFLMNDIPGPGIAIHEFFGRWHPDIDDGHCHPCACPYTSLGAMRAGIEGQ